MKLQNGKRNSLLILILQKTHIASFVSSKNSGDLSKNRLFQYVEKAPEMSLHVDGLNLLILLNPWLQLKSAICNKYHFQGYTFKLTELVPTSHYSRRSTLSSDRLQLLSVIISKYKMDTYVNSFFPNTARHF